MSNIEHPKNTYNSIVTLVLISCLIVIRILSNNYLKQNIIIAWINFFSMFYVLWRIRYQVSIFLKKRNQSIILKNQYKFFKKISSFIGIIIFSLMIVYSVMLYFSDNLYSISGCINDIISLFALLFSIEDEKIVFILIEYFRLH